MNIDMVRGVINIKKKNIFLQTVNSSETKI